MADLAPSNDDTPATEALTDDQIIDADIDADLNEMFPEEKPAVEAADAPEAETETPEADTSSDETDAPLEDADTDGLADDSDGPQDAIPDAPARWDAQGREVFAKMPPEAREYVLKRESELQGEHTRRQQELAQAKLELHNVQSRPETEVDRLIQLQTARISQYANVTPEALLNAVTSGEISQQEAVALQQAKATEDAAMTQLEAAKAQMEEKSLSDHVQRERLIIEAQYPELATPEAMKSVGEYLNKQGVSQDEMKWIDAKSLAIADKARRYDELQAARATSKPAPVKAGKPTKSASAKAGSSKSATIARLRKSNKPADMKKLESMIADAEFDAMFGD